MTISFVATVACLALIIRMIRAPETDNVFADREASGEDADAPHGFWRTMVWFATLFGFILALDAGRYMKRKAIPGDRC